MAVPTVMTIDGLRVVIYPNDHEPAHVHVMGDGNEARFALEGPGGEVTLIENYGFRSRVISTIEAALNRRREDLIGRWREIHGQD
ncbi:MAG TPA: DUF4160 domain-containing protein [Caulobacteraceae bacterium]